MKDDFEKEMDRKFNACWEQCIEWKKNDIRKCEELKDWEMVEFYNHVLRMMEENYAKVKIKDTKTP